MFHIHLHKQPQPSKTRKPRSHSSAAPYFRPWLFFIARWLIKPILSRWYRVTTENLEAARDLPPPFILVGNHSTFYDSVFFGMFLDRPVQFVITDSLLQGVLGKLIGWTGAIALTKHMNDIRFLRELFAVRDRGGIIGLFPEAQTSWDGTPNIIDPRVSRVIAKLGIPVVGARMSGGYLIEPKWAAAKRRGSVHIRYELLALPEELKTLGPAGLQKKISDYISHDDPTNARLHNSPVNSPRIAEYIENFLFGCPECSTLGRISSKGREIRCDACSTTWTYSGYADCRPANGGEALSLSNWNNFQNGLLSRSFISEECSPFFPADEITLLQGYRRIPRKAVDKGLATAHPWGIRFRGLKGTMEFRYEEISGCAVVTANRFEFYHRERLFEFKFSTIRGNGLKYLRAVQIANPVGAEIN